MAQIKLIATDLDGTFLKGAIRRTRRISRLCGPARRQGSEYVPVQDETGQSAEGL